MGLFHRHLWKRWPAGDLYFTDPAQHGGIYRAGWECDVCGARKACSPEHPPRWQLDAVRPMEGRG